MVTFALSVPLADIWQDRAWARQQQRLLTAQFGPDEVAWVRVDAVTAAHIATNSMPMRTLVLEQQAPIRTVCRLAVRCKCGRLAAA